MAYTNAQATPRSDIYALAMQANADFNKLFIGDKVMPVYGSDVKLGIYMRAKLANAELLNGESTPRSPASAYNRINRKYDTDTFNCVEYGGEAAIDDSYEAEVDRFMNLEATEAMLLMRAYQISYEARIAAKVFNASTFTATAALVAYTEANIATINAPGDVSAAKLRMLKNGLIPNAVVMSANVLERVRRSTLLQNQVYGVVPKGAGQNALPGDDDIARAFGVEKLLVGRAPKNANTKGQTYSGSFIWGDTYFGVAYIQGGEFTAGGVGRTIQWTKDTTGLFTPETYRDEATRSNILRVRQHTDEKVIDETAVELITTSYA